MNNIYFIFNILFMMVSETLGDYVCGYFIFYLKFNLILQHFCCLYWIQIDTEYIHAPFLLICYLIVWGRLLFLSLLWFWTSLMSRYSRMTWPLAVASSIGKLGKCFIYRMNIYITFGKKKIKSKKCISICTVMQAVWLLYSIQHVWLNSPF